MSSTGDNPYAPAQDTSIKAIYPIGSIIFCSEPLGGKYVWENVTSMDELTVEWQGCTWLFLTGSREYFEQDPQTHYWRGYSLVHTLRNYRVDLIKPPLPLVGAPFTAIIRNPNDETNWDPEVPPTIGGFSGKNRVALDIEELPKHAHSFQGVSRTWDWANDYASAHSGEVYVGPGSGNNLTTLESFTETAKTGENEAHENKEHAVHILMYKRIA